mgnify:CR=1 FL=1
MVKKIKCNICNFKFYIQKEKVKTVAETTGAMSALNGVKKYDAIDCPNCGCQKILWTRLNEIKKEDKKWITKKKQSILTN